jgi:predicted acetyltransferase
VLFDSPENRQGGGPKRLALLETDGRPEGYAIYRHKFGFEDGDLKSELSVVEAVALDGRPTAEIWRYLFDIDWSVTITAGLLPVDHQLWHMLATPRRMKMRIGDALWVRLVDVGEALSARAYAADGRVVFDVRDAFCPWNEGRWKLEGGQATRTDEAADLACDVTALGSVYLGGFGWGELVRGARAEELTAGAAAKADAIFGSWRAPWCPEIF